MSVDQIKVLLVEDNPGDARLLREAVREVQASLIELTHVTSFANAIAALPTGKFDVILLDLSLPDAEGLDTLTRMHAEAQGTPIVVLTGLDDEALALRAVREGAQDYLVKGQVTSQLLVRAMRYATERRRAVEALQQSEEYFRSLIENALDIILVLDGDGLIRFGSPSLTRVLGYDPAELTGQGIDTLTHPDDTPCSRELVESGGAASSFEIRMRHRNGSWRVLEAIGKRFAPTSFNVGYVLNCRDITQRKRDEDALVEVNGKLRAVIETSPLAIYSLDLSGKVNSWNRAAERIFGYTDEEVLNNTLPIIFPEDEGEFRESLDQAAKGQALVGYETQQRRKDGTPIEVSVWNATLRNAAGVVTGIVAAVADNTDRKRLEEQFRQAQKMEAVGRLAGGVAHDFNNLLTVITGYCQMLLDRLPNTDPLADDMRQVLKAADRATTLTKQLLAFSRRQIVQPKIVDLNTLVSDMDHILKRLVGEDIELLIATSPKLGKTRVDPGQIEQVIVNLVVNAKDAMPKGGKLTIETQNVEIHSPGRHLVLSPGPYVLLAVSDTGVGMDADTRNHLFEPFFTTKEKGRGTGLGLSTSYGIVKQNQGEILVYSEPGLGSTFKIYLPRVFDSAEDIMRVPDPEIATHGGTETIMIVEDEDGVRKVIKEMLEKQGYTVIASSSGAEAIRLFEQRQRDVELLITDVVMPRMSGRELADMVRGIRPELKVLFVSGYTDSAIVHHGVLDAGTHFLQKPFTPEQLAGKVREVLEPADRHVRNR